MDGANGIDIIGEFSYSASTPFRRERYNPLIRRAKKTNDSNAFILPSKIWSLRVSVVALKWVRHPPIAERSMKNMYPCPCCGYVVHGDPPGSFDICPICFWEDDISQLRFPEMGGANHVSLIQGQRNFFTIGACEERVVKHVRKPLALEQRELEWRPIDPKQDQIERPKAGVEYGTTYPKDSTELYYWRKHKTG
jgi:hypothetical protein